MPTDPIAVPHGMYGVKIGGLDGCSCLEPVPKDWPEWRVHISDLGNNRDEGADFADRNRGRLRFGDGSIADVSRESWGGSVRLRLTRTLDPCLTPHPYLATVGMFGALWGNRLPLHAGAVGLDGRAWLILASKSGGKSTTLAMLERTGHPVLSDDLSIVDLSMNVHRGPAFIDLRHETAEAMGIGVPIGVLGVRERWRHALGPRPVSLPLAGLILAEWGDPTIETVTGGAKVRAVAENISMSVPGPWDDLFMDIVTSRPLLRWARPQDLSTAEASISDLLREVVRVQ